MVIIQLCGGLGNQLFQYAVGRAVAVRVGGALYLDCNAYDEMNYRQFDLAEFSLRARILPKSVAQLLDGKAGRSRFKRAAKKLSTLGLVRINDLQCGYDGTLWDRIGRHVWLSGFWQSEKYFKDMRTVLLEELSPRAEIEEKIRDPIQRIQAVDAIAVHVRRGDLVTDPVYSQQMGTLGRDYYEQAIEQLVADRPDAHLFVFAEDSAWAEANIPRIRPLTMVSGRWSKSAVEDLVLMSHCKHFVIANSTFSWWGAWLSRHENKRVAVPARLYRVPQAWESELVPADWIRIETEPIGAA